MVLIASLLLAAANAFAIDCQVHISSATAPQSAWSGPCTPIGADGIISIKHPQIGELLSNFSQMQVFIDIGTQRLTSAKVATADIGEDLVIFKIDYAFQPADLPRPLDDKLAAALMEIRFEQLFDSTSPLKLGAWNLPRPANAFTCSQKPAFGGLPSAYECEANFAIPVTESADAGQIVVRHYAVQTAVPSAPMTPGYFNQLGRIYEDATTNIKGKPSYAVAKCDHQVVIGKRSAHLKVDFCVAASSVKQGLYDAVVKIGTFEKRPTAVILALTMKGFTQSLIKRVTTRYLDTIGAN